jgi:cell division protein FtsW
MTGLAIKIPALRLHAADTLLCAALIALLITGFVAMSSASIEFARTQYDNPFYHIQRHGFYLVLALMGGIAVFHVPTATLDRHGWWLLLLGVALLCLVLIVGREVNGSKRWLAVGPFTLQVSEFVKLFVIIYMAGYLVRRRDEVRSNLAGFLKPLVVMAILIMLLLAEPDFGAAVVIMGAVMGMLFLGGARLWQFMTLTAVALLAAGAMVATSDYRMERLLAYTNPWEHQYGISYQLVQALIAFGRGEWFGVGLGNSVQKLSYLPEAHTDFVFAILAEEMGAVGVLIVLALFTTLVGRMLQVARRAERQGFCFGAYLSYGAALLIALQVFINVGVNTGLLPTKGLTLPFFSYGGSSLITCVVLVALVARVELTVREQQCTAEQEAQTGQ